MRPLYIARCHRKLVYYIMYITINIILPVLILKYYYNILIYQYFIGFYSSGGNIHSSNLAMKVLFLSLLLIWIVRNENGGAPGPAA